MARVKKEDLLANSWANEMENDHFNAEFNRYLDSQPGGMVIPNEGNISRVFLGNIGLFTVTAIHNLASKFGSVVAVSKPPNSQSYVFVEFEEVTEAQKFIEHVKTTSTKMKADFARPRREDPFDLRFLPEVSPSPAIQGPNIHSRVFKGPFCKPTIEKFPPRVALTREEYNICEKLDPQLQFFNENALVDLLHPDLDLLQLEDLSQLLMWNPQGVWVPRKNPKIDAFAKSVKHELRGSTLRHGELQFPVESCKTCHRKTLFLVENEQFCSHECFLAKPALPQPVTLEFVSVASNSMIVITSVVSQSVVYVRSANPAIAAMCLRNQERILEECLVAPQLTEVYPGDLVAVKVDGQSFRALVLKVLKSSHSVRLSLLDSGAVTVQPLEAVFELPEAVKYLPVLVSRVSLTKCIENYFSLEACVRLLSLQLEEVPLKLIWDSPGLATLELEDTTVNEVVLDVLAIPKPNSLDVDLKESELLALQYPNGPFEAQITDSSLLPFGQVSVVPVSLLPRLQQIHEKVNWYGSQLSNSGPFCPTTNGLCLMRSELGVWFRGVCQETVGDQNPTIRSVDFGFLAIVNVDALAPLPEKLLDAPAAITNCDIKGFRRLIKPEDSSRAAPLWAKIKLESCSTVRDPVDGFDYLEIESQELLQLLEPYYQKPTEAEEEEKK